ncbi:MAG TPA: DUF4404 family protein [Steroidobacteraceae bacterium]|nr:DUF4404 family protein [Steroidobacteraceae bacterium]
MSGGKGGEKGLRELLARLRGLSQSRAVDADSRKHLSAVVSDIERGGAVSTHAPRLESLAVRFEVDHPALAEVIREVIDALVRGGV